MPTDKILHKIQVQINELTPTLELFVDELVQPSVNDCENLQKQLYEIQEMLAVYKFDKQNKELSPSFNIHAKVSAAEPPEEIKNAVLPEIKETRKEEVKKTVPQAQKTTADSSRDEKPRPPLAFGINDKFRFINELFSQNASEYHIVVEQLNNLTNWNETEIYLNSLKSVYSWKESSEVVRYFYSILKKRFDQ
jgi:hypothetical protein